MSVYKEYFLMDKNGLPDHVCMQEGLEGHRIYPQFAEQIVSFLVPALLFSSDLLMNEEEKAAFADVRDSREAVWPLEDFDFQDPDSDPRLQDEMAALRLHFLNSPQALIHGKLQADSIWINQTHMAIYRPEDPSFGPMGYDIGCLLSDLFAGLARGKAQIQDKESRLSFCGWCMCTIMDIVDLFKEKFCSLYARHKAEDKRDGKSDGSSSSESFCKDYLQNVMADAAGYAGMHCLRLAGEHAAGEHAARGHAAGEHAGSASADREDADFIRNVLLYIGKDLIMNRNEMQSSADYGHSMEEAVRKADPENDLTGPAKTILDYDTVALDDYNHAMVIIDQTQLPNRIEILSLTTQKEIWDAIYLLQVRGAPAIGVAAAIGIYLAAREIDTEDYDAFLDQFREASAYLNSSRPTAVNLSWALKRMEQVVLDHSSLPVAEIVALLHDEALAIRAEDIEVCRSIGQYGLSLIKPGDGLLTHCNAGQLATIRYGTATAPMYLGHEQGYDFKIYCDETRPLLQGARLTSFELSSAGMDVTVLCDNMSASLMREGKIQAVFVGCDRVAANGDAANKIGTSMAALAAKRYGIPFYVCAPTSTIDRNTPTGSGIVIEQRKPHEVTDMWYEKPMAPEGVKVYNPAFDVTDADLITAIITEVGIAYPPYEQSLKDIFVRKEIKGTVEEIIKEME